MDFDTETVKFGAKSIRIKLVDKAKPHMCATVYFASELLEPNKTYTFQAYAKTSKVLGTEGVALEATARDYNHGQIDGWQNIGSEYLTGTKDWTLISTTFTVPESNVGYIFGLSVKIWACMAGTAWFDGLALVEGDKALDYTSLAPIVVAGKTEEPTPAPTAEPTAAPTQAPDKPSTWAAEEIAKALEADLVPDHINSKYQEDITRSDFCDLIIKMIEKKSGKGTWC